MGGIVSLNQESHLCFDWHSFYDTFLICFRMTKNLGTVAITLQSHSAWEGVSFKPEIKQMNRMHFKVWSSFKITQKNDEDIVRLIVYSH